MIPIVKSVLLCAILGFWSIIGLLLWIPLLFRITCVYCGAVVASSMHNFPLEKPASALATATTFYSDGFARIIQSMSEESVKTNHHEEASLGSDTLWTIALQLLWSTFFWVFPVTIYLLKQS